MTAQRHPRTVFRRAIERGNLVVAESRGHDPQPGFTRPRKEQGNGPAAVAKTGRWSSRLVSDCLLDRGA